MHILVYCSGCTVWYGPDRPVDGGRGGCAVRPVGRDAGHPEGVLPGAGGYHPPLLRVQQPQQIPHSGKQL